MIRKGGPATVMMAPAAAFFGAFWLLPMARLAVVGASGPSGFEGYALVLMNPRYLRSFASTAVLSAIVTIVALGIAGITGFFLQRNEFWGKTFLVGLLSFPLAFPGVVVGFLMILLAGRQGLVGTISEWLFGERLVFAYGLGGLFLGYLYFSIPRAMLTIMANVANLDVSLEEAARTLGATPWRIFVDVVLPGLRPSLIATGAICFATSMGAFGTAFTLATQIDVLPITIYNEFTNYANFPVAAVLSLVLGLVTWSILAIARQLAGAQAAAAA